MNIKRVQGSKLKAQGSKLKAEGPLVGPRPLEVGGKMAEGRSWEVRKVRTKKPKADCK